MIARRYLFSDRIGHLTGERSVMSRSMMGFGAPAAAVLAIVLLTGCSGSGGLDSGAASSGSPSGAATSASPSDAPATGSASSTTTATAAPSADANTAAEADVVADYLLYTNAQTKSLRLRNARVTDLIRFSTAPQQAKERAKIATMRKRDIIYLGTSRNWVGPVSVVGNRATMHVCEKDDASWYAYASSRKVVGTKLDRWNPYEIRLLKRDGLWLVNLTIASKKISCKGAQ